MTFSYPGIERVFSSDELSVNCLAIENKKFFFELVSDVYSQTQGYNGKAVLSEKGTIVDFSKKSDLLTSFVPFDINQKSLLTKILARLDKKACSSEYCEKTAELLAGMENYIDSLFEEYPMDLNYNKLSFSSIMRAAGVEIANDGDSLPENIISYMSMVREFDCDKLFIIVNLRSLIDDSSAELFLESVCKHRYNVLMLESNSYERLKHENRFTIDNDLCGF